MKDLILFSAILAALFSKELDQHFRCNGKLRFIILVSSAAIVALEFIPLLFSL